MHHFFHFFFLQALFGFPVFSGIDEDVIAHPDQNEIPVDSGVRGQFRREENASL